MIVWACFVAAMTVAGAGLLLTDPTPAPRIAQGSPLWEPTSPRVFGNILETKVPVEQASWQYIVIHDSGSPRGSVETMSREAQSRGLRGLGYHFLIGNGNGMGDGDLHVGYRWNEQFAGAHATGSDAGDYNQHGIGICLIGNGEARKYTERQMERLLSLVSGLQRELNIPIDRVLLQRDLAPLPSPGKHFPREWLWAQLSLAGGG